MIMLKRSVLCRACVVRAVFPNQWRGIGSTSESGESPLRRLLQDSTEYGEAGTSEPELRWATEPYATRPDLPPESGDEGLDPREASILLFPGQGSQYVGMGKLLQDVPAARDLYELASSVVGWDVARVCRDGPADELDRRCQTAVAVTSLAALERLRDERPAALERVRAVAGFSLGELAALVWAGALPLEPALRLLEARAAAMAAAARARPGGMLALLLAPDARLGALLAAARAAAGAGAVCAVAAHLQPGLKVVAGDERALRAVRALGGAHGVRRAAPVRAAGAYHTPLMAGAARALRPVLRALPAAAPRLPVLSAVDARRYGDGAHVRRQLERHLTRPVLWEQTLHALYARPRGGRFPLTLALGPGRELRSTLRRVNARAWDSSLQVDA